MVASFEARGDKMIQVPLTSEEKQDIKKRLDEALDNCRMLGGYITNLKAQLAKGTKWSYTPDTEEEKLVEEDIKAFLEWLYEGKEMTKPYEYKWSWKQQKGY